MQCKSKGGDKEKGCCHFLKLVAELPSIVAVNSLAIFRLSNLMTLSSELPKLSRLMLPYQTIL
jgi:hypothetical protein